MTAPPALQPIAPLERIAVIDVLRGFALFGILAANMRGFNSPAQVYFAPDLMWTAALDRWVQGVIDVLISGKFITLFSFLFGLGFAVQLGRALERGGAFASVYLRRLFALLGIGAVHAFGLWWGDILLPYALLGFALLLFRRRLDKTVFVWAMVLLWFPVVLVAGAVVASALGRQIPMPPPPTKETIEQVVRDYGQGGFVQLFVRRAREVAIVYTGTLFFFPKVLGMFLLGLWVWRRGIVQNLGEHLPEIRRGLWWGLVLGLAGNLATVLIMVIWKVDPIKPSAPGLLIAAVSTVAVPALSCFYACAIALAWHGGAWRGLLAPFAAVGRSALSNYLLQSLVSTTIFYSYGFGLYGAIGPAAGLIPTFAIYLAQIPLSNWWLGRYRFGPAEWVWRSLTYGRRQPMRQQQDAAAAEA